MLGSAPRYPKPVKMAVCTPISTCAKTIVCLIGSVQRQTIVRVSGAFQQSSCYCCSFNKHSRMNSLSTTAKSNCFQAFKSKTGCHSLTFKGPVNPKRYRKTRVNVSSGYENMDLRLLMPKETRASKIECSIGPFSWRQRSVLAGLFIGLMICFSTAQPSYAESHEGSETKGSSSSHNKKVMTDYCVIGIRGDGRCLFHSVAHGACIRSGMPAPNENSQRN